MILALEPQAGYNRLSREESDMAHKTETIRARVDAKLKAQAEDVLEKLGLNASEAIRLFYRQIALRKGLPFEVALPNASTEQALKAADAGEDLLGPFDDTDSMFRELGV
ncbi:MAG TPA: type II toxin-antitoxin system RelB/DinJ family antitoxin [Isosphaeraceae bacterium]|nr:type II toxin-antitoxin system RelB/DinJ family antitoxin [Isosphaeraceae bacterium]